MCIRDRFIDEVQDYKESWLRSLVNNFLEDESEFIVFGDEKQNIYENPLDDNKEPIIPSIPGRWNKSLKRIYRFNGNLSKIAFDFQTHFLKERYNLEEAEVFKQSELDFINRKLSYFDLETDVLAEDIVDVINHLLQENDIHPGDATIMSSFCLLYTSPSPRDATLSRMPSSA